MEKMKKQSLKRSFTIAVAITMVIVFLCSALAIFACYRVQKHILPASNEVWLSERTTHADGTVTEARQRYVLDMPSPLAKLEIDNATGTEDVSGEKVEYMIEKIESSFSMLSSRSKMIYRASQVLMVLFPFLFAVIGIIVCAWWFYKKKLEPPIQILSDGTKHIREQDLSFQIGFDGKDELGELVAAFEEMRQTLYENNRQLWGMLEERRALQASVAHDLRNPIAIIKGYVEYLQENSSGGTLTDGKFQRALSNLSATAERMERYTDTMRDLSAIEEVEIKSKTVVLPDFLRSLAESLSILFRDTSLQFSYECHVPSCAISIDGEILYRVLENMISNSIRYAEKKVQLFFTLERGSLIATVTDDGPGFSEKILQKKAALFYSEDASGQHLGLGLAVSKVLCQKHGGTMELSNAAPHGACVKVSIAASSVN